MALLTLTVNNRSPALDKQAQEVALIARALELAAQSIRAPAALRHPATSPTPAPS